MCIEYILTNNKPLSLILQSRDKWYKRQIYNWIRFEVCHVVYFQFEQKLNTWSTSSMLIQHNEYREENSLVQDLVTLRNQITT